MAVLKGRTTNTLNRCRVFKSALVQNNESKIVVPLAKGELQLALLNSATNVQNCSKEIRVFFVSILFDALR